MGRVVSYPEMMYKIRSPEGVQQAILVTSNEEPTSPHRLLLQSPQSLSPCHPSSPPATVLFHSPSQIIYAAPSPYPEHRHSEAHLYDPLLYHASSYRVPMSIPNDGTRAYTEKSSGVSGLSKDESIPGCSDNFSELSDSSTSTQQYDRERMRSNKHLLMKRESLSSKPLHVPSPNSSQSSVSPSSKDKTSSLKRPKYSTGNYASKVKLDDNGSTSSVIEPKPSKVTTKSVTSSLSPLLGNQKESQV